MKINSFFRIKVCATAVLLAFCSLFGVANEAFASGRAIMMSPMSQRVVLAPGETYRGGFKVANPVDAENNLDYLATIAPFSIVQTDNNKDDYNAVSYTTKSSMNMIVDWTVIDNPTGTVEPNGEEVVSFSIEVPADAPAGGQYMAILVKEDPEKREIDDSLAVTEVMQMAHIIYAEVAGETNQDGVILENYVPSISLSNNLKTMSRVRNNGNIHTDAKVILQVWPLFSGEEICTNEENPDAMVVLPNTQRFNAQECSLPLFGIFRAKQTVRIFGEESVVEKIVFVCPVWLMFLIVFVIALIIIWFFTRSKSRKGSKKSKSEEQ
ncbi:hypothetical protein IKD57_01780 [Candidatus Saccharibacteria bacterium]|nr:hypothetical protein [Candidatus Saccharibacteria bacterium]